MDKLRLFHREPSWRVIGLLFLCVGTVGAIVSPYGLLGGLQSIVFLFAMLQAGVAAMCLWFHFTWRVLQHVIGALVFLVLWVLLEWYLQGGFAAVNGGVHYLATFAGIWLFSWIFSIDIMFPTEEE